MINPLKISEMLSKAGEMQEEMQRKLSETVVEAASGGGAVTVAMNGKKELLKIRIDPSAVMSLSGSQADVEMLQDLIVGAVNEAGRKADEAIKVERAGHARRTEDSGADVGGGNIVTLCRADGPAH